MVKDYYVDVYCKCIKCVKFVFFSEYFKLIILLLVFVECCEYGGGVYYFLYSIFVLINVYLFFFF